MIEEVIDEEMGMGRFMLAVIESSRLEWWADGGDVFDLD